MSAANLMEPTKALGQLELTPGSGASVNRSGQQQDQAHLNGCVPLSHQVAGHKYGVDKVGILQHPDGTVLKQVQPPPRGPREMQFYSTVFAEDCSDPCLLDLQNHLPKYYGTWSSPDSPNELYLKLEDVTSHFTRPCIMDVKLGQRSYDPFASQEKREQQIRKYPLMEEIGFLILGMRVYDVHKDTFDTYNQHYGRGLTQDTVKDGLARFFHNGVCLRRDAIRSSISRLQQILRWFHSQQQLAFYASSLLFVYEGLPPSSSSSSSSFLSSPSISDSEGEKAGREDKVAEYNNNTEVAVSWGAARSNRRKDGDGGFLRLNGPDGAASEATGAPDEKLSPNGNRNGKDGERGQEEEGRRGGGAAVEVRMIDFAHVFPSDGPDAGYIYGLKHLLTVLEQILCDAAHGSLRPPTS